jgi:hypothetical protein
MTSYKGMCVFRLGSGAIFNAKVEDAAGNQLTISPDDYLRRGVNPPIDQLPDCGDARPENSGTVD